MKRCADLCYSKIHLRNKLRLHKIKTEAEVNKIAEYISLIAETINNNKDYQLTDVTEGKTKEQLFTLGFSVSQIQKYFEYKTCNETSSYMRWFLKTHLIIDGKKIRTIKDLLNALEEKDIKCA